MELHACYFQKKKKKKTGSIKVTIFHCKMTVLQNIINQFFKEIELIEPGECGSTALAAYCVITISVKLSGVKCIKASVSVPCVLY